MVKIAVIGTGNMGAPMSINLAAAGLSVKVFDIVPEKMDPLKKRGITVATDHASAVKDADIVLTMLPTGVEVKDVYFNEAFHHAPESCLFIDSSTIDLRDAQEVHTIAKEKGFLLLDAPVSGGTAGAANGTLTFMVGGDEQSIARANAAFSAMGSRVIHCGAAGMGQAAKMCNNMMLGIQMASVVEGFHLARKVGLSDRKLYEVASSSSGDCFSLTAFCPVPDVVDTCPANNNYKPGFSTDLMLKDMRLALSAAQQKNLDLDMAPVATSLYQRFSEGGCGGQDFSAIFKLFENNQTADN